MRLTVPFGLTLFLSSLHVQAIDLEELQAAQEQADNWTKIEEFLTTGTPNEQIAIFKAIIKEGNPVQVSRAMEIGLNSDNQSLQTQVFRQIFRDREKLMIEVGLPDNPSPTQSWLHQRWKGLELQSLELSDNGNEVSGVFHTAEFKYNSGEGDYTGQIVRGGIQMHMVPGRNKTHTCNLITKEVTGNEISGTLDCSLKQKTVKGKYSFEGSEPNATLPIMIRMS
jgi:hypothetical protein